MIWNNTGKTISQIQIDFANGQGFQTVSVGTAINISYTDTGSKKWTVKVTLSDNSILQCYNEYNVLNTGNISSRFHTNGITFPTWGDIDAVNGTRTAATVSVNYSTNNYTGTLRKPLIVVEGYDVSFIAPGLQDNYGSQGFLDGLDEANLASWNFNTQLDDTAGYDLVFVDFADGAADIVLNAGAVQEVINRVNTNKVLDDRFGNIRQQNVVMGLSMGGLCARYALANMTKNFTGTPTETRLLITHDSPHKGANVPLGLQYLLRMVGGAKLFGNNILDIYPDYSDVIGLLNAPATQQLLTYRSLTANTFASNTFLDATYRPMITFDSGNPQPTYRFIATSLGNECASPVYNPYTQLLNINLDGFIFYFPLLSYRLRKIAETYALPATGSTSKIARFKLSSKFKLFGLITISKDYYDNTAYAPGSQLAIDGVPGAITTYASVTVPPSNFLFPIPGVFGFLGYVSTNTSGTPGNFTFVSTASALDATPYSTPIFSQKYVNGVNQNYPSTSETFIAQETNTSAGTTNNVHIRFTARNSRWLFNEMENSNNLENCSSECSNPYYIEGPTSFCSSGAYYIPGLQRGATVTWSASPSGIVTINSPNSLQTTLTKVSNGTITLTATISNVCGGTPIVVNKTTIIVGTQAATFQSYGTICSGDESFTLCANPVANTVSRRWEALTSGGLVTLTETSDWCVEVPPYTLYVDLYVDNGCGEVKSRQRIYLTNCGQQSQFTLSPNPSKKNGTITISKKTETTKNQSPTGIVTVDVYDNYATKIKHYQFPAGTQKATISSSSLAPGMYYLYIYDGIKWHTEKWIINE